MKRLPGGWGGPVGPPLFSCVTEIGGRRYAGRKMEALSDGGGRRWLRCRLRRRRGDYFVTLLFQQE